MLAFQALTAPLAAQDEAALAEFVDFAPPPAAPVLDADTTPAARTGGLALRKGLASEAVDQLLGPPTIRADRKEGTLAVTTRTYDTATGRVVAEFVEGVLVRVTITSR